MIQSQRPRLAPGFAWLLAALCAGAPAFAMVANLDAKKELQALEKELQQEFKHLRQTAREAADDDEAEAVYRDFQEKILPDFAARFAQVAQANKGSAVALAAWTKVVDLASQGLAGPLPVQALKALASDHLAAAELAQVSANLRYSVPAVEEAAVIEALRTIAAGSPHRVVQATALFSLGAVLGEERPADDPRLAEAKAVFAKLAGYADLEYRDGQTFAEAATAFVFALENLLVGKPCPDFQAVDAEGVAFKLSDYLGKVVLLDFWGFW